MYGTTFTLGMEAKEMIMFFFYYYAYVESKNNTKKIIRYVPSRVYSLIWVRIKYS